MAVDYAKQAATSAVNQALKAEKKLEDSLTVLWHELEDWQQDNHFIVRGYRPASNSYAKSARSLSYLHNETVNIYTHLIGAVVSVIAAATLYQALEPRYETATREDVFVVGCFFVGAAACLGLSATYHTISNHSLSVAKFGNQLDYLGILILIWGSHIPTIYYGFQKDEKLLRIYWTMITANCLATSILTISPNFRTPKWRPFRAIMFVATGLSGVVPAVHGIWKYGVSEINQYMGLSWTLLQAFFYISGAAIYAMRIPERWSPGRFDIWGSSHQIFHVLVLMAATSHLVGIVKAFDYWHSRRDSAQYLHLFEKSWW